jgi:predicted nucleic acid-binding protein
MYLLDTNVVSEIRKASTGKADPHVVAWTQAIPNTLSYISVMTLFEIEIGILSLDRRDGFQAAALRRWMEEGVKYEFRDRMISIDGAIALRCAACNVPNTRSLRDAFIGATAFVRGYTLVTRNVRDFQGMELKIVNPWQPQP